MIIRWPEGVVNPGRIVDQFATLSDFPPTILDITGVRTERKLEGESREQLYNLEKYPSEMRNWAKNEGYCSILKKHREIYRNIFG